MLSPDDPPARHDLIAADADLFVILDRLPEPGSNDGAATAAFPDVDLDDDAYILYTSGSTGTPKGVPISHRGLGDYLQFAVDAYCDDAGQTPPIVALHSALVFDLTITSLFLSFLTDGLVVVFDQEPITALREIAVDDRITFLKATPSQLELFVRLASDTRPLRTVVVGGEAFRRPVAKRMVEVCAVRSADLQRVRTDRGRRRVHDPRVVGRHRSRCRRADRARVSWRRAPHPRLGPASGAHRVVGGAVRPATGNGPALPPPSRTERGAVRRTRRRRPELVPNRRPRPGRAPRSGGVRRPHGRPAQGERDPPRARRGRSGNGADRRRRVGARTGLACLGPPGHDHRDRTLRPVRARHRRAGCRTRR